MYICIYSSIIIYITTLYDVSLFVRKLGEKIAYKQNSIHLYDHHYDRKKRRRIEKKNREFEKMYHLRFGRDISRFTGRSSNI